MEELEDLTTETFDNLLEQYNRNTETYNHYEFALDLAREATGYGTVFELLEKADLSEYTGFDPDLDFKEEDFEYDGFLLGETCDLYIQELNDGLSTLNLKTLPYFDEFYYDFLAVTGFVGEKEDFERNLRRSIDFFNFLVEITTNEEL